LRMRQSFSIGAAPCAVHYPILSDGNKLVTRIPNFATNRPPLYMRNGVASI
jgi:hypothetical protein